MKETILSLYEDLRFICLRLTSVQDNFNNDFNPKSSLDKKLILAINNDLDTIIADTMDAVNILSDISQVEDDTEVEIILNNYLKSAD